MNRNYCLLKDDFRLNLLPPNYLARRTIRFVDGELISLSL